MKNIVLNNEIEMPLLGFGTARMTGSECIEAVKNAIQSGYRRIDTANMYRNEKEVGTGIMQSGVNRKEIFITTKIFSETKSYEDAVKKLNKSLENLNTDYLDMVLVHEPFPEDREVYRALEDFYEKGIIKVIGVSNFSLNYLKKFISEVKIKPAVNQVEMHPYFQEKELYDYALKNNIILEAYAPFISGEKDLKKDEVLLKIAQKHSKTVYQVVLNYFACQNIPVLAKTVHPDFMKENLNVFDFHLSESEIAMIKALDENKSFYGWYE